MRYLVHIRIDGKVRIYPIDAKNEEEAIERLKLRLPPQQRETYILDAINIDPTSIPVDNPFGIYCD